MFAVSDGAHNGNSAFFFLPPLFKMPTVHPGTFNPDLQPSVEICDLGVRPATIPPPPRDCVAGAALVAEFPPGSAVLSTSEEYYQVNWHTDQSELLLNHDYRIRVLVGGALLGFADVDPVSNGSQLKNVQTNEYIGLVDGRTLPIKFRIEDGALCGVSTIPCNAGTIDLETGGNVELVLEENGVITEVFEVTVEEGTTAEFGGETVTDVTINVEECTEGGIDLDLRRFGSCLQVTTFFTETGEGGRELVLSNDAVEFPLVISTCRLEGSNELEELSEEAEAFITLHQQDGLTVRALSHVHPHCDVISRLKAAPIGFAQRGLRQLGDLAARLLLPQTLHAGSRSAVINLGGGGGTRILGTDCTSAPVPTSRGMLLAECSTTPLPSGPLGVAAALVATAKTVSKFQFFQPAIMERDDATNGLTAPPGEAVSDPPRVTVVDAQNPGAAVVGATVTFEIVSGGGNFGEDDGVPILSVEVPSNSDGVAQVPAWILGDTPGTNVVRARGKGIAARPGDLKPFVPDIHGVNRAVELPTPTDAHFVEFTATGRVVQLSGYEIVSSDAFRLAAGGGFARGTADCPAGKVVLGGGVQVVGEGAADFNTRLQESAPGTVGGGATSLWLASIKNEDEGAHDVRIFAICADPPPGYEIVATSTSTLPGGGLFRETANCPAGKVVMGGGAQVVGEGAGDFNTRLQESGPSTVGGGATSLHLAAIKNEDEGAHAVQIFAVCTNPVSGYEVVATASFSLDGGGGFNRATADCPAGKLVVGGGAQVVGEGSADFNTRLQESGPGTVGGGETSLWLVSIKNLDALGHTAAIRAVCVDGA